MELWWLREGERLTASLARKGVSNERYTWERKHKDKLESPYARTDHLRYIPYHYHTFFLQGISTRPYDQVHQVEGTNPPYDRQVERRDC